MNKLEQFRQKFQSMTLDDRKDYLKKLTKAEREALYCNPDIFLFDKQIIQGDQRYTILRCGRRFGKSVAGSAWIAKKIRAGHKHLALCGATYGDVVKIMVPNILKWFTPEEKKYISYNSELKTLNFTQFNAIIYCHTSDKEIRGFSVSALWCDELGSWCDDGTNPDKVEERFNIVDTTVSETENPQTIITSTPKSFPLYFTWEEQVEKGNPDYQLITGSMDDNPFLSEKYKRIEKAKYLAKGRWGKQELYGSLFKDVEGAAWTYDMIDDHRIKLEDFQEKLNYQPPQFRPDFSQVIFDMHGKASLPKEAYPIKKFYLNRKVVGIDPTVSDTPTKDECGIMVVALGSDNHIYVLKDYSGHLSTAQWGKKATQAAQVHGCGSIVIEKNQGVDTLPMVIRQFDRNIPIKLVNAREGKLDRAYPVAALYEQGLVHHVGTFPELEKQMTRFVGNDKVLSDRLDALVHSIIELKLTLNIVNRNVDAIPYA